MYAPDIIGELPIPATALLPRPKSMGAPWEQDWLCSPHDPSPTSSSSDRRALTRNAAPSRQRLNSRSTSPRWEPHDDKQRDRGSVAGAGRIADCPDNKKARQRTPGLPLLALALLHRVSTPHQHLAYLHLVDVVQPVARASPGANLQTPRINCPAQAVNRNFGADASMPIE